MFIFKATKMKNGILIIIIVANVSKYLDKLCPESKKLYCSLLYMEGLFNATYQAATYHDSPSKEVM